MIAIDITVLYKLAKMSATLTNQRAALTAGLNDSRFFIAVGIDTVTGDRNWRWGSHRDPNWTRVCAIVVDRMTIT